MATVTLLFSYGTLQSPSVQKTIFGLLLDGHPDAILGHRLQTITVTDPVVIAASGTAEHPVLVPDGDPTAAVAGTVYDLDDLQLAAADAYEIDAYQRREIMLQSGRSAHVYALTPTP